MKKLISCLLVLVLCLSMACAVTAAENDFVPSITYKPAPELKPIEGHEDCIIITPVSDAEKSDKIPEDAKRLLLKLYDDILKDKEDFSEVSGLLKLIKEKLGEDKTTNDLVVRDLFDVTALCDDLKTDLPIKLTFNGTFKPDDFVAVVVYQDGKWVLADSVINEDGSITATFNTYGPVAFLVPGEKNEAEGPTGTGDTTNFVLWSVMATLSLMAIVLLFVGYRRNTREAESK